MPHSANNAPSLLKRIIRRFTRLIWSRESFEAYLLDLASLPPAPSIPQGIQFRIHGPEAAEILLRAGKEYDLENLSREKLQEQFDGQELLVCGWYGEKLTYYGWAQFRKRRLARHTSVPIGSGNAFIYRCFTHPEFRGRGIYPAALHFLCAHLAASGFKRAFIDHHVRNTASGKGILRAGFRTAGNYKVTGILGFKWAACDTALRQMISDSVS